MNLRVAHKWGWPPNPVEIIWDEILSQGVLFTTAQPSICNHISCCYESKHYTGISYVKERVERTSARLATWKTKFALIAGRLSTSQPCAGSGLCSEAPISIIASAVQFVGYEKQHLSLGLTFPRNRYSDSVRSLSLWPPPRLGCSP